MRKIQPIPFWDNAQMKDANYLSLRGIDNLINRCMLIYSLISFDEESGIKKTMYEATIDMDGSDYDGYTTNDYAYEFAANKLGLTLIESDTNG